MKVTIDIPDTTMAVFVSVMWDGFAVYKMGTYALDTDEIRSGKEIKLPREETNERRNSRN